MLDSNKISSKIIIGLVITLCMLLMLGVTIFLLSSEQLIEIIQPRLSQIFFRIIVGITIYSAIASYLIKVLNKYSFQRDSWKRWLIELLFLLTLVALASLTKIYFEQYYPRFMPSSKLAITNFALFTFAIGTLVFMVYEIWATIEENQKLQVSLASAEKDKIALQLNSLQQKLNPHFLFNSLNSLSELMYEDTEKANEFIHKFSNLYRYVLDVSDTAFVEVRREMKFLESYLFLQKIRFGDKLIVNIELSPEVLSTYTPPLAFQLLLENAIKHNQVSIISPLVVTLTSDEKHIIFKNNIQPRNDRGKSTGVGQSNLKSTYSILSQHHPQFSKSESEYTAKLPILKRIP